MTTKPSGSGEKRAALKVQGAASLKKQKTPTKVSAKGALVELQGGGLDFNLPASKMEAQEEAEGMADGDVAPYQLIPEHLTGARDWACQEQ
jgi:hypothetical protein